MFTPPPITKVLYLREREFETIKFNIYFMVELFILYPNCATVMKLGFNMGLDLLSPLTISFFKSKYSLNFLAV